MVVWKGDRVGGVGGMAKRRFVRRLKDRMRSVVVFWMDVLRLICGYAPQSGDSLEEKQSFYD